LSFLIDEIDSKARTIQKSNVLGLTPTLVPMSLPMLENLLIIVPHFKGNIISFFGCPSRLGSRNTRCMQKAIIDRLRLLGIYYHFHIPQESHIVWIGDSDKVVEEGHHYDDLHLDSDVILTPMIDNLKSTFDNTKYAFNHIPSTRMPQVKQLLMGLGPMIGEYQ
jgi:hypothetical protein